MRKDLNALSPMEKSALKLFLSVYALNLAHKNKMGNLPEAMEKNELRAFFDCVNSGLLADEINYFLKKREELVQEEF